MKVACVQTRACDLEEADKALENALGLIEEAIGEGADLIVLPECSYPAYFVWGRQDYRQSSLLSAEKTLRLFSERAKEGRCYLAVGLVLPKGDTRLENAAVLFGPGGEVVGRTAKSFLWHFDRHWFSAGESYPVFDTSLGRIGMMVCADGRMPEIARILALKGAQVILDPTALVTSEGVRSRLSNAQIDYMLPVRALENGVWMVVANKVGLEADTILYCGRSCVIDPMGNKVAVASSDSDELLTCEIDSTGPSLLPVGRKPTAYQEIAEPTDVLPITRILKECLVPDETVTRVAAIQLGTHASVADYLSRVEGLIDVLCRQDTDLIVLPEVGPGEVTVWCESAHRLTQGLAGISRRFGCGLACAIMEPVNGERHQALHLWDSGMLVARYRKLHGAHTGQGSRETLAVVETRFGRLGLMIDEEGLVPEVARCLMLRGADILVWSASRSTWPLPTLARARADENKVYVVLAASMGQGTSIAGTNGSFLAAALPDVEQAIAAQVTAAGARYKEMAPSTHVVWGRMPHTYDLLVH